MPLRFFNNGSLYFLNRHSQVNALHGLDDAYLTQEADRFATHRAFNTFKQKITSSTQRKTTYKNHNTKALQQAEQMRKIQGFKTFQNNAMSTIEINNLNITLNKKAFQQAEYMRKIQAFNALKPCKMAQDTPHSHPRNQARFKKKITHQSPSTDRLYLRTTPTQEYGLAMQSTPFACFKEALRCLGIS